MAGTQTSASGDVVQGLSRAQLHDVYRYLVLARRTEEQLEILFKQGHVTGGLYRSLGQEAGAVGAAYALRRRDDGSGDLVAQTIRATGAVFVMGGTPLDYFRQYLARRTGPTRGREANVHWCDFRRGLLGPVSPLGTMVGVTAGVTLAFRMKGEDRVGMVFSGDGASSTGAWHEGLNFAAVRRCPMVLVVEANRWAFSTPTSRQTRLKRFTEKCPGYGISGVSVDGNDVLEVHRATREAVGRARRGEGVQMVELRYYRRLGHAQHDPQDYVDPAELAEWEKRDPLVRYRTRLLEEAWASEAELDALDAEVDRAVREASDRAVSEPEAEPLEAMEGIWTDLRLRPPWYRTGPDDRVNPHVVRGPWKRGQIDPFRPEDPA